MMVSPDKPGKVLPSVICQWNLFFHFSVGFCLVTLESLVTGILAGLWLYLQTQALRNSPLELPVCGSLSFCLSSVSSLFALWCVCVSWRWRCFGVMLCWQPGHGITLGQVLRFAWRSGWQVDFRDFREAEKETSLPFQHLEDPWWTSLKEKHEGWVQLMLIALPSEPHCMLQWRVRFSPPNAPEHIPCNSSLWRNLAESLFGSSGWVPLQSSLTVQFCIFHTSFQKWTHPNHFHMRAFPCVPPFKGLVTLFLGWLLVWCSAFIFIVFTFPLLSAVRFDCSMCHPNPEQCFLILTGVQVLSWLHCCWWKMDFSWVLNKQPSTKGANLSKAAAHKQNKYISGCFLNASITLEAL